MEAQVFLGKRNRMSDLLTKSRLCVFKKKATAPINYPYSVLTLLG